VKSAKKFHLWAPNNSGKYWRQCAGPNLSAVLTGGERHPAVTLTPEDVINLYADLGFHWIHTDVVEHLEKKIGYDGFIMACGQK
jgi:hypothetical protein